LTATTTLSERIAAAKNLSLKRLPSLERYLEANAIRMPEMTLPFDVSPSRIVRWHEMENAGE
jgi:hypothetical protein